MLIYSLTYFNPDRDYIYHRIFQNMDKSFQARELITEVMSLSVTKSYGWLYTDSKSDPSELDGNAIAWDCIDDIGLGKISFLTD